MGCFDTVVAQCPDCGGRIDFQSKAHKCELEEYSKDCVPTPVAYDLAGSTEKCKQCGSEFTLQTVGHLESVPMYLGRKDPRLASDEGYAQLARPFPTKPKTYDLWLSAHNLTGVPVKARCYAKNMPGDSFRDAVIRFSQTSEAYGLRGFDERNLSFGGIKVFETEEEAR